MDGMVTTAQHFAFLMRMRNKAGLRATMRGTRFASRAIARQNANNVSGVIMAQIAPYPVCRETLSCNNTATMTALTQESRSANSGGTGPSVPNTVSLMTTTNTGISRAMNVTGVKCVGRDGRGLFVSNRNKTEYKAARWWILNQDVQL